MTDIDGPLGRIDLRTLDARVAPDRIDQIVTTAVLRSGEGRPLAVTDLLSTFAQRAGPLLSAAAVLIVLGASVIRHTTDHTTDRTTDRTTARPSGAPVRTLAAWADSWIDSRRVPTNGEVLAAFGGYR